MASKFLKSLSKVTGNEFSTLGNEDQISDIAGYIDTGSYIFNALVSGSIYGGIPSNKITVIAGEEATGKTFFLLGLAKSHLDANSNNEMVLFDSESAIPKSSYSERGVDGERVHVNPISTIEEFKTQMSKAVEKLKEMKDANEDIPSLLFALDSFGMLSTAKEMADSVKDEAPNDMTRARVAKAAFRILTLQLAQVGCPLIVTNHVYTEITKMFAPMTMGGGKGLAYAATTIIYLSKKKEKDGSDVVGDVIHCYVDKSRLTKPHREVDVLLTYDNGLNRYYGLEELACKYGIFEKLDKGMKIDGKRVYLKELLKNPTAYYTKDVLDKLDEAAKKEFKYGSSQAKEV